jgi:predicted transposase/invertase (TIGR01784 family)
LSKISPTGDLAFKKVLASEENKDILGGLIQDFLGITADEIIIENPYSIASYTEAIKSDEEIAVLRYTLKDIVAVLKKADFISEVQVKKTMYFDERALYYPFERYCQNYNKPNAMTSTAYGKPIRYSSLRPVLALNILGYTHFQDDSALRIFELYDPIRHKSYGKDLIKIGFFELAKTNIETPNQKHWHDYFTTGEVSQDAPEYIQKASRIIDFVNLGKEEKEMALALEKAQAIYDTEIASSFFEGMEAERETWQGVVAEKDVLIAEKDVLVAEKDALVAKVVAEKDVLVAEKDALIAELRAQLSANK